MWACPSRASRAVKELEVRSRFRTGRRRCALIKASSIPDAAIGNRHRVIRPFRRRLSEAASDIENETEPPPEGV